jgi:hypothetical protein
VRELLKELETKESANKETVQILKQEFVEHKTTYEKVTKNVYSLRFFLFVNKNIQFFFKIGTASLLSKP